MNQATINHSNRLIADFLGWVNLHPESNDPGYQVPNLYPCVSDYSSGWTEAFASELDFCSSWDWIMPVVEKIESKGFMVKIEQNYCLIRNIDRVFGCVPFNQKDATKLDATYSAVCQFVEWLKQTNAIGIATDTPQPIGEE